LGFALVFAGSRAAVAASSTIPTFWALLPNLISTLDGVVMILLGDVSLSSTIGDRTGVEIRTSTASLMEPIKFCIVAASS
jgi:hypothetical protein